MDAPMIEHKAQPAPSSEAAERRCPCKQAGCEMAFVDGVLRIIVGIERHAQGQLLQVRVGGHVVDERSESAQRKAIRMERDG